MNNRNAPIESENNFQVVDEYFKKKLGGQDLSTDQINLKNNDDGTRLRPPKEYVNRRNYGNNIGIFSKFPFLFAVVALLGGGVISLIFFIITYIAK
jgi:hypothetical protein